MSSIFRNKKKREAYERNEIKKHLRGEGIVFRKDNVELKRMKLPADIEKHAEKKIGNKVDDDFIHVYSYGPKKGSAFRLKKQKNKIWDGGGSCFISESPVGSESENVAGGYVIIPRAVLKDKEARDALLSNEVAAIIAAKKFSESKNKQDMYSDKVPKLANEVEESYLKKKYKSNRKVAREKVKKLFHDPSNWGETQQKAIDWLPFFRRKRR
jgi:hypothetical protein